MTQMTHDRNKKELHLVFDNFLWIRPARCKNSAAILWFWNHPDSSRQTEGLGRMRFCVAPPSWLQYFVLCVSLWWSGSLRISGASRLTSHRVQGRCVAAKSVDSTFWFRARESSLTLGACPFKLQDLINCQGENIPKQCTFTLKAVYCLWFTDSALKSNKPTYKRHNNNLLFAVSTFTWP